MRGRTFVALLALSLAVFAAGSAGATGDPGFMTSQASMLTQGDRADVEFKPIITVGETLGSYRFESIPDGISLIRRTQQKVDLYVNHETSLVAFPYVAAGPTAANSQNDFDNSQLSQLSLNPDTGGVIQASMAISTSQNYQRFCSNYLATRAEGFSRATLFTNEEAQDWVFRSGTAWTQPIPPGTPGAEQPGVVAAHDVRSGQTRTIYGMGRFNHENDVALPGFDGVAVLSGDDTFSTTPASSQLYLYTAGGRDALWNDRGTLHAFVADDTSKNDYFDVQPGDVVSGTFVSVPKTIASGKKANGAELLSTDFPGMPAPPAGTPDGPQWVLDQWGNKSVTPSLSNDVFDFIRIEDTAYDKRAGMSNVVYLADSGRGTAGAANPLTTSTNGRIWKLELDPSDPLKAKLSILVAGGRQPRQDARRDPPARQPRDDGERKPARHRGSGLVAAVRAADGRPERHDGSPLARAARRWVARRSSRRSTSPRTRGRPTSTRQDPGTSGRGSRAASWTRRRSSGRACSSSTSRPTRSGSRRRTGPTWWRRPAPTGRSSAREVSCC